MKVKIKIDGFVNVPDDATETQIEDAIYFALGLCSTTNIGEPDWVNADVEVSI